MKTSVKLWIIKANNDLTVAKNEIKAVPAVTDVICFHCQQCVEKYLKAFIAYNDKLVPKIHDLVKLIEICVGIDKEFEHLFSINLDKLTVYAVEMRYPDDFYIPSVEEAKEAIELAERAKEFVLKKLVEKGYKE